MAPASGGLSAGGSAEPGAGPAGVLVATRRFIVAVLVVTGSVFALYTGAVGPYSAPVQRGFFVLVILPLVFLLVPAKLFGKPARNAIIDLILAAVSIVVMTWLLLGYERLFSEPFLGTTDLVLGVVGLLLVLEAVRRTVGPVITLILLVFLEYAVFGDRVPVDGLRHGGLDLETVVSIVFYSTDGVFGTPIGVCATFIVLMIMLGTILTATGGAELFMNVAKVVGGRFVGGPAKIAVVGSALMGMITGATVANVATTGSVTIPMMKRAGYTPRFAGAVEALASSGGQLMPPIMGAAAFVMIDYLGISYGQLLIHASLPAGLYFLSVLWIVHVRSMRRGLGAVPREDVPDIRRELAARGHMVIPVVVLVGLLAMRHGVMSSAFWAVASAILASTLRQETRIDGRRFYDALHEAMAAMGPLVAICAGAGIVIGVLAATGLSLKIAYLIEQVAAGSLFVTLLLTMVACIILGMGLPTVAAYVVLATLVPASLIRLGVPDVAAHLFIFYFAILSAITPPVCTGAYVAAGIARADPIETGFTALRLGLIVFLLPFAFVYEPALLMIGSPGQIALHVATCILGIGCWAYGLEGWWRRELGPVPRAFLLAAGVMLIWPSLWISVAGIVAGAAAFAMVEIAERPAVPAA
ncbi:MAG TPA: TRAP transporter fused permease subunit [Longimicrobiales bacterium]|nr:TRAP transporter fused permease subunit [Longimicrobiales bacterium]